MFDVISIGSSLVDIFVSSAKLQSRASDGKSRKFVIEGDKVELDALHVFSGGGGTNTAVGLRRLGFRTALMSETGQDNFSSIILAELQREDVDTSLIVREKKEQTGGSVMLVAADGGRTALIHRGASSELDPYDIPPFWLSQARWVHLTNIAGQEAVLRKIFQLLAKNPEVSLSWNPGKQELALLADGTLAVADVPATVLILNAAEWELVQPVQTALMQKIPQILVTQGKNGGYMYLNGQKSLQFSGAHVESVDDTGAGDAFSTGYVAGQLLKLSPETCIQWGVTNAGSVIRYFGAKSGLLDRERMQAQLAGKKKKPELL